MRIPRTQPSRGLAKNASSRPIPGWDPKAVTPADRMGTTTQEIVQRLAALRRRLGRPQHAREIRLLAAIRARSSLKEASDASKEPT
jgi:hypothetical protein